MSVERCRRQELRTDANFAEEGILRETEREKRGGGGVKAKRTEMKRKEKTRREEKTKEKKRKEKKRREEKTKEKKREKDN